MHYVFPRVIAGPIHPTAPPLLDLDTLTEYLPSATLLTLARACPQFRRTDDRPWRFLTARIEACSCNGAGKLCYGRMRATIHGAPVQSFTLAQCNACETLYWLEDE